MKTEELIKLLNGPEAIAVFGTGFVARMFSAALAMRGMAGHVNTYAVTEPGRMRIFEGKPVKAVSELAAGGFSGVILLAVHEALADILMPQLQELFPGRVVWIGPNLTELLYGKPVAQKTLSAACLQKAQDPSCYWITVRYAAVRSIAGRREEDALAEGLYVKAIGIHCGPSTARARYGKLEKLVASFAAVGYDPAHPILIDENGLIIDGLHRFACARYFGLREIPCEVVPASPMTDRLLTEKNRLPAPVLREAGVTEDEMLYLEEAARELCAGTGKTE